MDEVRRLNKRALWVLLLLAVIGLGVKLVLNSVITPTAHEYEYFVAPSSNVYPLRHYLDGRDITVPLVAPRYIERSLSHYADNMLESNGYFYSWFIAHVWSSWFYSPRGGEYMRALPILFSILNLFLVYRLGCKVHSRRAGIYAAFFLSIHGIYLAHSIHNRFYACNEFFCLSSTLLVIALSEKWSRLRFALYAICAVAMTGTQFLSLLLLVPQFFFLWFHEKRKLRGLGRLMLVAVLVGQTCFWLYWRDRAGYERFHYGRFDKNIYVKYAICLTASNIVSEYIVNDVMRPHIRSIREVVSTYTWCMLLITWLSLASAVKRRHTQILASVERVRLLWSIRLFSLGFYGLFSLLAKNILVTRNYSWMLPFFALLTALGFLWLPRVVRIAFLLLAYITTTCSFSCVYLEGRGYEYILQQVRGWRRPGELIVIDDSMKLSRICAEADYLVPPVALKSPLAISSYIFDTNNLGSNPSGRGEIVVRGRFMPGLVRMLRICPGENLRGKRLWLVGSGLERYVYNAFMRHRGEPKLLLYYSFCGQGVYYLEF